MIWAALGGFAAGAAVVYAVYSVALCLPIRDYEKNYTNDDSSLN